MSGRFTKSLPNKKGTPYIERNNTAREFLVNNQGLNAIPASTNSQQRWFKTTLA